VGGKGLDVYPFIPFLTCRRQVVAPRDDKGKGDGSIKSGCWSEAFFITLDGSQAQDDSGRDAGVNETHSNQRRLFPLSSRAQPRDLQFQRIFRGNVFRQSAAQRSSVPFCSGLRPSFFDCREGFLAGVNSSFELGVLSHREHLRKLWAGLIAGFDQILPTQ
jgi:hypothetical protein